MRIHVFKDSCHALLSMILSCMNTQCGLDGKATSRRNVLRKNQIGLKTQKKHVMANSKMDSFQYGKNPFWYLQFPLRFFLGAIATAISKMDVSHTKDTIHFYICQTPRIPMCRLDGKWKKWMLFQEKDPFLLIAITLRWHEKNMQILKWILSRKGKIHFCICNSPYDFFWVQ